MQLFGLLVLGIALNSVAGQVDFDTKGCTECPLCYNNDLKLPINYGQISCGYCLCRPDQDPLPIGCGEGEGFDNDLGECVPMEECAGGCVAKDCPDCYHGMDYKVPHRLDDCKYCLCLDNGNIKEESCDPGYGWNKDTYQCEPNPLCGCHDNCENVTCDPCYHGMQARHPNPINVCSFCCCLPSDEYPDHEIAEFKRCPLRHEFDPILRTCVPTNNDLCKIPAPEDPCNCTDCQGVVCDPAHYGEHALHENIANKCSFCCCVIVDGKEEIQVKQCEDVMPGSAYDPVLKRCVPSDICPNHGETNCTILTTTPPPTTTTTSTIPPCIRCEDFTCPASEYGTHYLFENPSDKCSFCCCIENPHHPGREIAVEKPCIYENSEFDPISKKCVPSSVCPGHGKPWYCY